VRVPNTAHARKCREALKDLLGNPKKSIRWRNFIQRDIAEMIP
jgi:hypothetical protein